MMSKVNKYRYLGLVIVLFITSCQSQKKFDLVLINGEYFDVDKGVFMKTNIGINNGIITDLSDKRMDGANVIDASGMFIYPGIIDAHCHFYGYAQGLLEVNLVGTKSFNEVIERAKKFAEANPQLEFIFGRGWDQNDWLSKKFPNKRALDSLFPKTPVILTRIDGHAALANSAALDLATHLPKEMVGGRVIFDDNGPTGMLLDKAINLIVQQKPDIKQLEEALVNAQNNCFAVGLTGVADAGLSLAQIFQLKKLQDHGLLKMPIYAMLSDNEADFDSLIVIKGIKTNLLNVKSIKVYGDGALGSRGALLLEPYTDDGGNYGLLLKNSDSLAVLCRKAYDAGFQVNVHAIGDSANRMVLQVFSNVLPESNDARWRVEHAQIVHPSDSVYFQRYKILPSVQPIHTTSDMYWAQERLGNVRIKNAYAYANMLRWAKVLPLGTDFPVEDIDPRKTLYAATVRQDASGWPDTGFYPQQRLSRLQALRGMTIDAAFAQFEEAEKGSIEVNKWADLIISPVNLLTCKPKEILTAPILTTIVHGEVVYSTRDLN